MYNLNEETNKAKKRGKIVDVAFYFSIIAWSLFWFFEIWRGVTKNFINISLNDIILDILLMLIILAGIDFMLAKFFIWIHGRASRIRRENE